LRLHFAFLTLGFAPFYISSNSLIIAQYKT